MHPKLCQPCKCQLTGLDCDLGSTDLPQLTVKCSPEGLDFRGLLSRPADCWVVSRCELSEFAQRRIVAGIAVVDLESLLGLQLDSSIPPSGTVVTA